LFFASSYLSAYSVLTHEAIIDSAWDTNLKPLLLQRFPKSTGAELVEAHAYAYGGCIIQDMGYYPFGSRFFSDLVHYVRSGDFIQRLIRESQDRKEYAFALGALAHYAADTLGHSVAVNPAVAIEYPKLRRKYGDSVTYYEKPTAHIRVEFAFDVDQVAHGNYAPESYRDFIGFKVSKELLERAFQATYDLELSEVFGDLDLAIGTYRRAVSVVIPQLTKVAWSMHKDELGKGARPLTRQKFVYRLSRADYRNEWSEPFREPGFGTKVLTFVIRILPKIGPLKALKHHPPSPESKRLFQASFNQTLKTYRQLLDAHRRNELRLVNRDFDTGAVTKPGEYPMADDAYSKLAIKLAKKKDAAIHPELRREILSFFADRDAPFATRKDAKQWKATLKAVDKLRSQAMAAMPY
jgi:zinc dependent phospholipase C